jgi:3'(2'), 5'-bisphosphate nucleotidase
MRQLQAGRGFAMSGDSELAHALAEESGRTLLDLRVRLTGATDAARGSEGDRVSQAHLARRLADTRPGDAVLSEEAPSDPKRLTSKRVWIIDPLDGTREFSESGRRDWAVHVALWAEGRLVAGSVALPAQQLTLSAHQVVAAGRRPGPLRIVVSRTRPPWFASSVAAALDGELVSMGSVGAKVAAIIQGAADIYLHSGGQHEWDSAAPVAVALAAGLHASRLDGSRLQYNQPDPVVGDLLVCRPDLATPVLQAVRALFVARDHRYERPIELRSRSDYAH